jgi:hypothetical protein
VKTRVAAVLMFILALSCTTLTPWNYLRYDNQFWTVQTLSLFNQRVPPLNRTPWKGDWLLRRERLELVDTELYRARPDVVIFQEMLMKQHNKYDSDREILSSGTLEGYSWDTQVAEEYEDTAETESQGIAASFALKTKDNNLHGSFWKVKNQTYLSSHILISNKNPILIFNLNVKEDDSDYSAVYNEVLPLMQAEIQRTGICNNRVLLAGRLPGTSSEGFVALKRTLSLKDTSVGFCELEYQCFTATPLNGIFKSAISSSEQRQLDWIFVHEETIISDSKVAFTDYKKSSRYSTYGLSGIWPSMRFGWQTTVRLAKCD